MATCRARGTGSCCPTSRLGQTLSQRFAALCRHDVLLRLANPIRAKVAPWSGLGTQAFQALASGGADDMRTAASVTDGFYIPDGNEALRGDIPTAVEVIEPSAAL